MGKGKKTAAIQVVSFLLGGEEYGAAIDTVSEIRRHDPSSMTGLPMGREYAEGMLNLRGTAIPVINLRSLVGRERKPHDKNTRVIIVDAGDAGERIGFVVDSVSKVTRFREEDMDGPPAMLASGNDWIVGMAKADSRIATIVDLSRMVGEIVKERP